MKADLAVSRLYFMNENWKYCRNCNDFLQVHLPIYQIWLDSLPIIFIVLSRLNIASGHISMEWCLLAKYRLLKGLSVSESV